MDLIEFKKLPITGILRGIEPAVVEPLVESVCSAGLKTIEVTMNTSGAEKIIKKMILSADGRLAIGAGTVLNLDSLKRALDSGATFIVSPVLVKEVAEYCRKKKIPFFPGAFTPQEIYIAWQAGATMVKVFPAKFFGPDYFKEIKGPFAEIELLACGGINPDNISLFFQQGASAVAFGASVFKPNLLSRRDFLSIQENITGLIKEFRKGKAER